MAKAKEIAVLECSADARIWAAEVLRVRFGEIVRLRGAVLNDENIEAVHDMRVGTRRLRSALRDFATVLRKHPLKKINKDLKKLADLLGTARDEDVAIAALEKLKSKAKNKAVKTGIYKLIDERRTNRERAQLDLTEKLSVTAIEDLHNRFDESIDKAAQNKTKSKTISFSDAGHDAVLKSLDEFCDLSVNLYAPFGVKNLHKLRISAKRLRYAIELFTACRGEKIAPFAEEISEMQTFLGEVHDADTWIENFSSRLLKNDKENSRANLWLLSRFVKLRTNNYRAAIKLRSNWQTKKFVERLRDLIS